MTTPTPNPGAQGGSQGPQPQQAPWGTPPPPLGSPKSPRRRKGWVIYGVVPLVSLFVGVGIGSSGGGGDTAHAKAEPGPAVTVTETARAEAEPGPTVTETVTATPKETKQSGPAASFSGEGEYLVGEDIKPGTYKTAGPEDEWGCYWERAKDASGEFDSIIANNNLNGPGRVTLNNGEYFKTNRCQEWTRVG